jgi:hypothetical protein
MRGAILAFATLIALSQTAIAGVPLFGHVSCAVVRFYVAKYSQVAAETWARSHGANDAEIETARRCLRSAVVQTASLAASSQVLAPVPAQERAKHEPAERDPDRDALRVIPVQGQLADPEQDKHDSEPAGHGGIRPKDIEDRPAGHVSYAIKDLARSDGKNTTLRGRHVGAVHRGNGAGVTGHVSSLKRLWDHLTRRRQFNFAFLHFKGDRR